MMKLVTTLGILSLLSTGCASTSDKSDSLNLSRTSPMQWQSVESTTITGVGIYPYDKAEQRAEWIRCALPNSVSTALVMHRDTAGYDAPSFCGGWIAQVFLANGLDVITVNRPGYVKSTGRPDFCGPQSVAAIEAGIKASNTVDHPIKPIKVVWGYSSGTIAAAFASKKLGTVEWLIAGGGIYDLESTFKKTNDPFFKREIGTYVASAGDTAFDDRSIAFDAEGLPKKIVIYHGKQDEVIPVEQAQSFRDTLAASEYQVSLQVLDGIGHNINWMHHRQVIDIILRSLSGSSGNK